MKDKNYPQTYVPRGRRRTEDAASAKMGGDGVVSTKNISDYLSNHPDQSKIRAMRGAELSDEAIIEALRGK